MKDLAKIILGIIAIIAVMAAVGVTDGSRYELAVRAGGAAVFAACVFAIWRIDYPKNKKQ